MSTRGVTAFLALSLLVPVSLVLVSGTAEPAAAATSVNVPGSIDATGGRDVTADLGQFFASVPPGSTVEFPDRGKFRIDGVLRLSGLHDITVDGNGSVLFAPTDGSNVAPPGRGFRAHWPRLREHVEFDKADTLTVRDLDIQGPNSAGRYEVAFEGQAGFAISSSSQVVLEQVSVSDTYGDGVYVAGGSSDVSIRDSNFAKIGRQGVRS
jgi:hypothetical protein